MKGNDGEKGQPYRKLNDGRSIPMIGFGTYQIKDGTVISKCLDDALVSGYRLIDTASVYRNEKHIGKYLPNLLKKNNLSRKDIFITTKIAPSEQGEENCTAAVNRSLSNLKTAYLDLVLIHWPGVSGLPPNSSKHREGRLGSYRALEKLQAAGKVKSIGVSNFDERHLDELLRECEIIPAVNQIEVHPHFFRKQRNSIEVCAKNDIFVQAYSSLGTTSQHSARNDLLDDETIGSIAEKHGVSRAAVLLLWAVGKGFGVLPKSTSTLHIIDNFDCILKNSPDFLLSEEDVREIDAIGKEVKYCWDPTTIV